MWGVGGLGGCLFVTYARRLLKKMINVLVRPWNEWVWRSWRWSWDRAAAEKGSDWGCGTVIWASQGKQGQCPRQTARNHNKNRQHSLRFKWILLFRPYRLGVLSRLLQRPKRKKHMQTVCLKSVCVSIYACLCANRKEKMLTNCSQRRLFLAVVIQRAVSLLSVPVFIAVAVLGLLSLLSLTGNLPQKCRPQTES